MYCTQAGTTGDHKNIVMALEVRTPGCTNVSPNLLRKHNGGSVKDGSLWGELGNRGLDRNAPNMGPTHLQTLALAFEAQLGVMVGLKLPGLSGRLCPEASS